jgi:Arc/MetJ family transcription regulator
MGFRMKTTLNIDDSVMAELKREAERQGRTMSELVETALRLLLRSQRKRAESSLCRCSAAAARSSILPTATPCTKPWKVANCSRSTNVLVYAADADSQFHRPSTTARVRARAKR